MSQHPALIAALTSSYKTSPESLRTLVAELAAGIPLPHRAATLFELGNACWTETSQIHPAAEIWDSARQLYAEQGDDLGIARCCANLASVHQHHGDDVSALAFWSDVYRHADMTSIPSTLLALQSCVALSLGFYRAGNWDEAVRYGSEAVSLWAHDVPTDTEKARVRMAVGMSLYELEQDEEALVHIEAAITIRERLADAPGTANSWRAKAFAQHRLRRREAAIDSAQRALHFAEACGDLKEIRLAHEALSLVRTTAPPYPDEPSSRNEVATSARVQQPPAPQPGRTAPPSAERIVRVFVSSTFLDFHAEREELVKRVFPELRRRCAERGLVVVDVDLRWGITEEQAARGDVIATCLAEIDRCRPYFIGLLGERYGSVPADLPEELLERYPWLKGCGGRSVTELEMLHGALNAQSVERRAFFYFRDPNYVAPGAARHPTSARDRDVGAQDKLADLKQRIRSSGVRVHENYETPESVGDVILNDLSSSIDESYRAVPVEPLDRTAAEHAAFAAIRARTYVGRTAYSDRLNAHAQGVGPPLVVLGEQGAGKSALLANWTQRHAVSHPGDFVLAHFIGAGSRSADWLSMIRRILEEFNRTLGLTLQIPDAPAEAHAAFARGLRIAAHRQAEQGGRIVLAIDGLDQLEDWGAALDLKWLPETIPDPVRLAVSTLPGRPLEELQRRMWPTLVVEPLTLSERKEVIECYLGAFSKRLGSRRVELIAAAPQAANPLYLRALLEELRVWGIHERLDERIDHYLVAPTAKDLFGRILERYEEDYERDRAELVHDAMSALWAARRGLSESELLAVLGSDGVPLPRAVWSPLFLAAASGMVDRAGLLGFFHGQLKQAVRERYVPDSLAIHRRLVDYFTGVEFGYRKIEELPWHLARAGEFGRLFALLSDPEFFHAAFLLDSTQVRQYWAMLEREGNYSMAVAYRAVIERPGEHLAAADAVRRLLNETGHWDDYSALNGRLIEHYRQAGEDVSLSRILDSQANLFARRGQLSEAAALLEEERRLLAEERQDPRGWESWFGTMAMVVWERGESAEAWQLLTNQERLLRGLRDRTRLGGCLIQKSFVLHARRDYADALRILHEAYGLAQETDDPLGQQAALGEMALNHQALGDFERAAELLRQQADICRRLGDRESLAGALGNLGNIYLQRRDWQAALEMYEEMERIGKAIGHGRIEHVGRASQAQARLVGGDLAGAEELITGVPEFFRGAGMAEPLNDSLKLAAQIQRARQRARGGPESDVLDTLRQRAAAAPASPEAQLALGDALKRARLPDDAIAAYRRALKLRPDWDQAELKLADLILSQEFER